MALPITTSRSHPNRITMELWHDRILVLDFGSQYTQLIARRIREAQVYSQILPCTVPLATILAYRPQGIVLSGGPSSVYEKKAPRGLQRAV